jgi:hypothetical protein
MGVLTVASIGPTVFGFSFASMAKSSLQELFQNTASSRSRFSKNLSVNEESGFFYFSNSTVWAKRYGVAHNCSARSFPLLIHRRLKSIVVPSFLLLDGVY